jgi:anthranilate phosphoribosyltransferase
MKERLEKLLEGRQLNTEEARALMREALTEPINPPMVASLLTALRINGITVDALDGFCQALAELAVSLDLGAEDCVDVCGTGGDNKGTFNISTTTAFILAAAGYKVAKHGNYAVSSACGSSNVLEALGISLESDQDKLRKRLAAANVCFLHAPLFHPAMKLVAPIRKELGFRTLFNMLGPLVNPANPAVQVNGVYDRATLRLYSYLLKRRGKRFATFCTLDGYDEVTLTAPLLVASHRGEFELVPSDFGLSPVNPGDIQGGQNIEESALIVSRILQGKGTKAHEDVAAASAGLAMWTHERQGTLMEHVARARQIVRTGAAEKILEMSRKEY